MSLERFWSALTTEVKLPVSMLCQGAHDKNWGMLVHFCKLFRQYHLVILGMVQIMMCKYSMSSRQTPSCVNLTFILILRLLWGGNTSWY